MRSRFIIIIAFAAIVSLGIVNLFGCTSSKELTVKGQDSSQEQISESFSDEVKVIYQFADEVNKGKYEEALNLLTVDLRGVYSMNNNAPLRNIESMRITKLQNMTGVWSGDRATINMEEVKVFYGVVDYRIKEIIFSYLKNGPYYHKIVVVRETKDSPWKIQEMSASPQQN